jgi:hypothetical protein
MSSTSVKVAFAFVVALAYQTATSAGHAVSMVLKNVSSTTIDSSRTANCPQRSPAAADETSSDNSVCWAPLDNTDGAGV